MKMKFEDIPVGSLFVKETGQKFVKMNDQGRLFGICNTVEVRQWCQFPFSDKEFEVKIMSDK